MGHDPYDSTGAPFDAAISKTRKIKHLSFARLCAAAHCLSTLWNTCGQAVQCKQNYAQKISRLHELSVASERRSFDHNRRTRQRRGLALDRTRAGPQGSPRGASGEERGRRLQLTFAQTGGSLDSSGRTDRKAFGRRGPKGRTAFGPTDPGGRRQECSSEHARRAPRPRT